MACARHACSCLTEGPEQPGSIPPSWAVRHTRIIDALAAGRIPAIPGVAIRSAYGVGAVSWTDHPRGAWLPLFPAQIDRSLHNLIAIPTERLYAQRMVALARLVPSLRSLLIFESVARSGSCSAAAREFNLTQPSASRNIAQLESHLGVALFTRTAAGMSLTREGQMLYQALGDGFHRVEGALQELSAL